MERSSVERNTVTFGYGMAVYPKADLKRNSSLVSAIEKTYKTTATEYPRPK